MYLPPLATFVRRRDNGLVRFYCFFFVMNFSESGLKPTILRALEKMGYEQATPIQQQTLTLFPQGKHIL